MGSSSSEFSSNYWYLSALLDFFFVSKLSDLDAYLEFSDIAYFDIIEYLPELCVLLKLPSFGVSFFNWKLVSTSLILKICVLVLR